MFWSTQCAINARFSSVTQSDKELQHLMDTFEFLDDWTDRYAYLIDIAKKLEPLEPADKTDSNKVEGCMSQVWLVSTRDQGDSSVLHFKGDSDAQIVKGLVAVVILMFSGKKGSAILETDEKAVFKDLGLDAHLSVGRRNGLESMVAQIKSLAQNAMG